MTQIESEIIREILQKTPKEFQNIVKEYFQKPYSIKLENLISRFIQTTKVKKRATT